MDRITALLLIDIRVVNDIRESVGRPLRRIRFRAPSPRSRIELSMCACSIDAVAAIGMTALSEPPRRLVPTAWMVQVVTWHLATRAGQSRTDGTDRSSGPSTPQERNSVEKPVPDPDSSPDPDPSPDPSPSEASAPGHNKCKRHKGNRPLLPWCADRVGRRMATTSHRVETNIPSPMGIYDFSLLPSSGRRPAWPVLWLVAVDQAAAGPSGSEYVPVIGSGRKSPPSKSPLYQVGPTG